MLYFNPSDLVIKDESEKHKGHSGWKEGGQTHFHVYIVSDFFSGKSKLQRHRIINELLHDDIKMIHALSLSTKTSDEVDEIE